MEVRGSRLRMDFDPLAFIEAEYEAVLAQGGRRPPAAEGERCESDSNAQSGRNSSANDDDEDDDASGSEAPDECYALLPSSPHASDDEEEQEALALDPHDEVEHDAAAAASAPSAVMDAAKRETIMQSMRQLSLPPPSWAKKANLSDSELVALVQKQLGTAAAEQQSAA